MTRNMAVTALILALCGVPGAAISNQPSGIEELIDVLADGSGYQRARAATMLGEMRHANAVQPLIAATGDPEWKVRLAARDALVEIGDPAVSDLRDAAGHENAMVRMKAISALGQLRCVKAVPVYMRALRDENWMVREEAALALIRLPTALTEEHLVAALDEINNEVRCTAAWVLGEIRAEGAVNELIAVLNDPDSRCAAAVALGKIGAVEAIPALEKMATMGNPFANISATWALELLRKG